MSKSQFVHQLRLGHTVQSRFAIVHAQPSNGKSPHKFLLRDKSGDLRAKVWPNNSQITWTDIQRALYADVCGLVEYSDYSHELEVTVHTFDTVEEPDSLTDFLPACPRDAEMMWRELKTLVHSLQNPTLRKLLDVLFRDRAFRRAYTHAPAAQHMHHPYIGGLLEHSLEVAHLCDALAQTLPHVDRDLLIVSALLHDMGKVEEIDYTTPRFAPTRAGGLLGHVFLGAQRIYAALGQIASCPEGLAEALCHLLLSHQGKLEWGSPVMPCFYEAYLLHACDQLSAQNYYCRQAGKATRENGVFQKVKGLEGRLFTGEFGWNPPPSVPEPGVVLPRGTGEEEPVSLPSPPPLRLVEEDSNLPPYEQAGILLLPILGRIAAGIPTDAQEVIEESYPMPLSSAAQAGDYLLRVRGDSMEGAHILDGDLVHVRPQLTANSAEIVVALVEGESTVKRLILESGRVILRAENARYPDICPQGEVQIQGKVIGVIRSGLFP